MRTKRSKWIRKSALMMMAASSLLFANCVTRGFHEKKMSQLQKQHREAMANKTRQMEAQEQALINKNKQYKRLLARYKNNCRQKLTTLSNKNSAKARRLQRAMAYINRLEAKLNDWKGLHKRLTKMFKVKIAEGTLSVKLEKGRIVLRMPEKVLFKLGSAKLMANGKSVVSDVARVLAREPYRWQVAGHTDPTGKASYNWDLSYRRAMAVLKVLLKHDMPPAQISAAAYGQYQPRASNDTKDGRALNRRTEIVFIPKLKALLMAKAKKVSAVCLPPKGNQAS